MPTMTIKDLEGVTIKNMEQIATLTQIAKSTSQDIDKLVKHMDKSLPLAEKVTSLERRIGNIEGRLNKVMWAGVSYLIGLCAFLLTKQLGL